MFLSHSFTLSPKLALCHYLLFWNQSPSMSTLVIFGQNVKVIALRLSKRCSLSSLVKVQSKSSKFNFCHVRAERQGYSLTYSLILVHFHTL